MHFRYLDRLSLKKKKKDFLKGPFKIEVKSHQHLTLLGTLIMYVVFIITLLDIFIASRFASPKKEREMQQK